MGLRKVREKVRKFQDGEQVQFFQNTTRTTKQLKKNNHNSSLYSHVLIFEQRNEFGISITRTFFANDVKIQQFNCSNVSIQQFRKDITAEQSNKYFNIHLCQATKVIKRLHRGGGAYFLMKF